VSVMEFVSGLERILRPQAHSAAAEREPQEEKRSTT